MEGELFLSSQVLTMADIRATTSTFWLPSLIIFISFYSTALHNRTVSSPAHLAVRPRCDAEMWPLNMASAEHRTRGAETEEGNRGRVSPPSERVLNTSLNPQKIFFLPLVNLTTPTVPHISFFLAHGTMISPLFFFLSAPSAPPQNISSPCKSGFF